MRKTVYKTTTPYTRRGIATQTRASKHDNAGSQVRPGPRRAIMYWVGSGRLVSLLLFFASMGMLVYLITSPYYSITDVRVAGNAALTSDMVTQLSGLSGTSVWFVDTDVTAERLLQNAYIEQVRISVLLPNQAAITIVERKPEVRWQLGGVHYLVDSNGTVLDVAQTPPEPDTLVIEDTTLHTLQPNDRIDADALNMARVLALRLPTELNFTPASIGWDFGLGVFVKSSTGQTIVFGRTDNLERKLAILHYLLADNTAFTYLDLRPSNPFYQHNASMTEPVPENP